MLEDDLIVLGKAAHGLMRSPRADRIVKAVASLVWLQTQNLRRDPNETLRRLHLITRRDLMAAIHQAEGLVQ